MTGAPPADPMRRLCMLVAMSTEVFADCAQLLLWSCRVHGVECLVEGVGPDAIATRYHSDVLLCSSGVAYRTRKLNSLGRP
jgi:hypothetical protein